MKSEIVDTDVCCLGELLVDFVAEGNDCFRFCPGGAPANVAVGLSRLGCRSALLTCVGSDRFGERLLEIVRAEGVDTSGAQRVDEAFTTLAFVDLDSEGERSFFFARHPGADTLLRADRLPGDRIARSRVLHFGSLSLSRDPSRSATLAAIARARSVGRMVSFDVNYRASIWPSPAAAISAIMDVIKRVDVVKASDEEACLLTGLLDPVAAARRLLDWGPRVAIVTMGASGCLCACRGDVIGAAALRTDVLDTNGAGDSFMAAFLAAFLQRRADANLDQLSVNELGAVCQFAAAAAAVTVSRRGAMPALPTLEEAQAMLDRHAAVAGA